MRKSPKNWSPLVVAIIAVVASGSAIYFGNAQFDMALKQDLSRAKNADVQFEMAMNEAKEANKLAGEALATDQQHAEHAKLNVHLSRLENRLIRQGDWLNEISHDVKEAGLLFHNKATDNWREADRGLLAGNFDRVRELIEVGHDNIDECFSAVEGEAGRQLLPPTLPPKPVWIGTEEELY